MPMSTKPSTGRVRGTYEFVKVECPRSSDHRLCQGLRRDGVSFDLVSLDCGFQGCPRIADLGATRLRHHCRAGLSADFRRRAIAEAAVRPLRVVLPPPLLNQDLRLAQVREVLGVQALASKRRS